MDRPAIVFTVYTNGITLHAGKMLLGWYDDWSKVVPLMADLMLNVVVRIHQSNSIYLPR